MNKETFNDYEITEQVKDMPKLPSSHQPGDHCSLFFGAGMVAENCNVLKVHFSTSKVFYDVEALLFPLENPESGWHKVRFYNVESSYLQRPQKIQSGPYKFPKDEISKMVLFGVKMCLPIPETGVAITLESNLYSDCGFYIVQIHYLATRLNEMFKVIKIDANLTDDKVKAWQTVNDIVETFS